VGMGNRVMGDEEKTGRGMGGRKGAGTTCNVGWEWE